jgi:DNA-binding NarL/FixJ family response regulator
MHVIIGDNELLYRRCVSNACALLGHEVVSETNRWDNIFAICTSRKVDLLVTDLCVANCSGGSLIESLEQKQILPKLIVVSSCVGDYLIIRLKELNVRWGFIDKSDADFETLLSAITSLEKNVSWLSTQFRMRQEWLTRFSPPIKHLNHSDHLYLRGIAREMTDQELAGTFNVSIRTAEGRRSALMRKLGFCSTLKLTSYLRNQGYCFFPLLTPADTCTWPYHISIRPDLL